MLVRTALCVLAAFVFSVVVAFADPTSPSDSGSPAPVPAATASSSPLLNIAFDQIDRTLGGTATPPPPNAFADEVQAAKDAQKGSGMNVGVGAPSLGQMAVGMIPVVGAIFEMSQAKKQAEAAKKQQQAMMDQLAGNKPPVLTRYAFYNGWTRVETANSIIITKPDQHLTVFIDPGAKTYRSYDTNAPAQTVDAGAAAASTESGEATADSMISMNQADSTTIDDQPVMGYSEEAIVTLSGSSGSCHDGTFRAKELEYFAQLPDPLPQTKEDPLDLLALPDDCSATIQRQVSGASFPSGEMYVYKLVTVVRDPNTATQQPSQGMSINSSAMMQQMQGSQANAHPLNYMLLSQRGNIRQLSAADESLFEIPQGYTEDK
jgi:hypothetical protein